MLSPADVRGELVAILTPVATDVALKGLAETVAAHVDGEHDVVQEEDAAVRAVETAHGAALPVHHLQALPGRRGRPGALLHRREADGTCPLPLWVGVFGLAGDGAGAAAGQPRGQG